MIYEAFPKVEMEDATGAADDIGEGASKWIETWQTVEELPNLWLTTMHHANRSNHMVE